jgi:hypothetical protein
MNDHIYIRNNGVEGKKNLLRKQKQNYAVEFYQVEDGKKSMIMLSFYVIGIEMHCEMFFIHSFSDAEQTSVMIIFTSCIDCNRLIFI